MKFIRSESLNEMIKWNEKCREIINERQTRPFKIYDLTLRSGERVWCGVVWIQSCDTKRPNKNEENEKKKKECKKLKYQLNEIKCMNIKSNEQNIRFFFSFFSFHFRSIRKDILMFVFNLLIFSTSSALFLLYPLLLFQLKLTLKKKSKNQTKQKLGICFNIMMCFVWLFEKKNEKKMKKEK